MPFEKAFGPIQLQDSDMNFLFFLGKRKTSSKFNRFWTQLGPDCRSLDISMAGWKMRSFDIWRSGLSPKVLGSAQLQMFAREMILEKYTQITW